MTPLGVHRVTRLDLKLTSWAWPFATERRAEIDAHFAACRCDKPRLWNGQVLLARHPVFAGGSFAADYFRTDFASFLAWRDWGFPGAGVFNIFGMGALRGSDGAFLLGEMAGHTANAGRIYFPSGTPDLDDVKGESVDLGGSVAREVEEETGLAAADYRPSAHWVGVVAGAAVALIRVLELDVPAEVVQRRIEANLARQQLPELCAIHRVRGRGDLAPTVPRFVTAFIAAQENAAA